MNLTKQELEYLSKRRKPIDEWVLSAIKGKRNMQDYMLRNQRKRFQTDANYRKESMLRFQKVVKKTNEKKQREILDLVKDGVPLVLAQTMVNRRIKKPRIEDMSLILKRS